MADEILKRDQNRITVLAGVTDDADQDIMMLRVDPITKRLKIAGTGVGGGVTSIAVEGETGLTGAVTLSEGANITLTQVGNDIEIASSGGGTPGGADTQVQYNNAGAFGGITGATTNGTALTLVAPILGTPASGTLTNCTGLPISTGVSGLGANVATFLATPSSANLASAVTGETGSGALVFGTSPTITTPTLSGAMTLEENAAVLLDPALSADGKYTGITRGGTAGATLAFGDLCYLDPTDSRWELCDANAAAGADGDSRGILGICILAAAADGDPTTMLLYGTVRADTAFPAMTINAQMYVSETAGDITGTQPVTADAVIRVVGMALTADELMFIPSSDYITHI